MENYQIYGLKEPGTDIVKYIGITGRTLHIRLRDHLTEKGSAPKHNWIKRLKSQNLKPEIELLEDGLTLEDALKKETQYILLFKSFGAELKNLTLGGEGVFGYVRTQEQKDHLREVKQQQGGWKGEKNPMFGKSPSEEHKKKMREAQRLKGCSQETREKRRIAMTGRIVSETEIANKIKSARRGEENPTAKLNATQVLEIRKIKAEQNLSNCKLAKAYNVTPTAILKIVKRKTWRHI